MSQILNFDQLNLNDAPVDPADQPQIETMQIRDETVATGPEDPDPAAVENVDFTRVCHHENSNDSSGSSNNSYDGIPINTNHDEPIEKVPNKYFSRKFDGKYSTATDGRFPPNEHNFTDEDQWSPIFQGKSYRIRNQRRNRRTRNVSECTTSPEDLFTDEDFLLRNNEESLYNHGTNWESALRLLETDPKVGPPNQDLAPNGAFYLNRNYMDTYQWLYSKRGSFGGEHAMLIYNFNPKDLSKNGKELTDEEWRDLVCENHRPENDYDWVIGPINANPSRSYEPGQNIPVCRTPDGEIAKQLVIRSQPMCRQLQQHLVGCIFYEKINFTHERSNSKRSADGKNSTRNEKRRRSKTQSKTRGGKRFHGN